MNISVRGPRLPVIALLAGLAIANASNNIVCASGILASDLVW